MKLLPTWILRPSLSVLYAETAGTALNNLIRFFASGVKAGDANCDVDLDWFFVTDLGRYYYKPAISLKVSIDLAFLFVVV